MANLYTVNVSYSANGGSGSLSPSSASTAQTGSGNVTVSVVLKTPSFTRSGYKLKGWATSSGGGVAYSFGGTLSHVFTYSGSDQTYNTTLYAVWEAEYVYLNFNANGGSGAPAQQTRLKGVSSKLPSTVPTRSGYKFAGWSWYSSGTGTIYQPSALVSITKNSTLYAVWQQQSSTASVSPSRIAMDGLMAGTITITKANSSVDHHTVIVKVGSSEQTFTDVGTTQQFTLPLSYNNQVSNATEITAKVIVHSYLADETEWGSGEESTFTAYVPETIVPSVSITIEQMGDALAKTWGIYMQQYSSVKFSVSASGQYSATVTRIEITGPGISASASGSSLETTSSVFAGYGEMQYAIIAYDSRGRSKTEARTITVEQYFRPVLVGLEAFRSTQQSVPDDVEGAYITTKFTGVNCSAPSENDVVVEIKYKLEDASSYTSIENNAVANHNYVVSADITKSYLVYVKATDEFGNYTETVFRIGNVVCSLALGLNNDRARFGGPCRKAGLEVDWKTWLDDDLDVLGDSALHGDLELKEGQVVRKQLWSGSWSSGSITVDGISQYIFFIVRMSGQGTQMLVSLYDDGDGIYFRGFGGYSSSSTNETIYYLNATLSGDTLTMVDCHSINASGTRVARTVIEIIGII